MPEHFRAVRSRQNLAFPNRVASLLRNSLFEALSMANITLFAPDARGIFGVQLSSKHLGRILEDYSMRGAPAIRGSSLLPKGRDFSLQ